ncbi:MAG: bifunctional pyr operon transcriptional regulator/uracil phosphoribosyltransferase PyrR [Ferruginibacter sp.]
MQTLLSPQQLQLTINRLAHQLLEEERGIEETVFIGLQPRGIFISDNIIEIIKTLHAGDIFYGKLDITFYRDDIRSEIHRANQTDISFNIENKTVILIDDVLYTGRTVRAALDALQDFGRPKAVKLCVLVNRRFGREFPIQPDYCGLTIDSNENQKVKVMKDTMEVVLYS